MPSYRDLMPDLSPLQRVINRLSDFSLPSRQMSQIHNRARQEAASAVRPQQTALRNTQRTLQQQRAAALNALQGQRNLLPQLFAQGLQSAVHQVNQQEAQRGVLDSGLRLQNILGAGAQPLAQYGESLQNLASQQAGVEQDYFSSLMSQVFQPQRELAAQQGADAVRRYQTYINQAQEALFQGRVQEAEQLLNRAQMEYSALIQQEEGRLLRQQMEYARRLSREQASLSSRAMSGSFSSNPVSGSYSSIINKYARQYGVSPSLIKKVIQAESGGRANAVSPAGAQGLMQLMPATARSLGVSNPFDPDQNIRGGTKYLSQQLKRWNGNVALALASYNAGPGRVQNAVKRAGSRNWNAVKRYLPRETQNYVARILG